MNQHQIRNDKHQLCQLWNPKTTLVLCKRQIISKLAQKHDTPERFLHKTQFYRFGGNCWWFSLHPSIFANLHQTSRHCAALHWSHFFHGLPRLFFRFFAIAWRILWFEQNRSAGWSKDRSISTAHRPPPTCVVRRQLTPSLTRGPSLYPLVLWLYRCRTNEWQSNLIPLLHHDWGGHNLVFSKPY